ncbi:MAG: selenocysteine-specific translation elongation factor [Firmicutes bacterium HGW-Firmicutes-11]|jgi:selenocysteine-specific elongation factor|nr:MAG: selenocysteine-specific translation elongation factor [Firmicutes bacterium HGW-Firmicutes-11]
MHNVIVGTAGHVDHGKTCLIKALTGIDTDRLKEEKKRGITIELGFADMPNSCGQNIGIIDVPGHERFVRNMLAGVGGIDLVLLVVAADEGVMPQTIEHFEILKMLGIEKGIVVLTKSDLVDEAWMELVIEDVRQTVLGTFLEKAPVIPVSSHTGQNIEELKQLICDLAADVKTRRTDSSLLRIPIDRVFTIGGFGTVITGTLTEGQISVGDEIQIYPGSQTTKVRSLQVHGNMVETAYAGQRTAVNLLGIKKEDLERGNVLAAKGSLKQTMMVDVKLKMFDDSKRILKNESRVHLYYGSAEALCKVVLLDREALESGQEGFAQLRLEEEIAVRKGDRFIIRFYSPVETIGGGQILDAFPTKHKRNREDVLAGLAVKEQGDQEKVLEQMLLENRKQMAGIKELATKLGVTEAEAERQLAILIDRGTAFKLGGELAVHQDTMQEIGEFAVAMLEEYHDKHPISEGMQKGEFRKRLSDKTRIPDLKSIDLFLRHFVANAILKETNGKIHLPDFRIIYSEDHQKIRQRIEEKYLASGYQVPEADELFSVEKDKVLAREILEAMASEGTLKKINYQNFMHKKYWEEAMRLFRSHMEKEGSITLAEYRDLLGASRKYAVMILEYLDEQKITVLTNDSRTLVSGSGKE